MRADVVRSRITDTPLARDTDHGKRLLSTRGRARACANHARAQPTTGTPLFFELYFFPSGARTRPIGVSARLVTRPAAPPCFHLGRSVRDVTSLQTLPAAGVGEKRRGYACAERTSLQSIAYPPVHAHNRSARALSRARGPGIQARADRV